MKIVMQMRKTKVPRLLAVALTVSAILWAVFAYQRARVLVDYGHSVCQSMTSLSGFKYLIGLSMSAEEARQLFMQIEQMEAAQAEYQRMMDMRKTL